MERPTVVIISDEPEFSSAATRRWSAGENVPSFILAESASCNRMRAADFDLAVVGGLSSESIQAVLDAVQPSGKPVLHVSRLNGNSPKHQNLISLPEVQGWPDLLVTVANQVLERELLNAQLTRLLASSTVLEQEAALGRYMLEVRHNLNNALTSILGNSDLILLDQAQLSAAICSQVETIRNMGMRMNEVLQRFSSLQKEMQLMDKQSSGKRAARGAAVGK